MHSKNRSGPSQSRSLRDAIIYSSMTRFVFIYGILYKADPDPDPNLQKKQTPDFQKKGTLYQHLLHEKKTHFDKFQGADFKYDNSFFNILAQKYPNKAFLLKNTQIRHFQSQIQAFLFFREILLLGKFEGADFKYDNIVFKFQPQNTQIRHFWSQIQAFLFFREILQTDKSEGAGFKYDNSFLKILV